MTLSAERRETLLAYCRIGTLEPGEEALLKRMYLDALGYLADAGVSIPPDGTTRRARFDGCVDAIVLETWDHRGTTTDGPVIPENRAFRRKFNQLKLTEPIVSESDTMGGRM